MNELNEIKSISRADETTSLSDSSVQSCEERNCFRHNLKHLLHSYRFHLLVVALVILDCIIVVIELMIDLQLYRNQCDSNESHESVAHTIAEVLHFASISILCVFVFEICLKVYAFRKEYFTHWDEVFDGFIILTSLVLDIVFIKHEDLLRYIGLFIGLRLWRIVRVIHGIAISVKTPLEHSFEMEKKSRVKAETELAEIHLYVNSLEFEIISLRSLLKKHNIEEVPQSYLKIDRRV